MKSFAVLALCALLAPAFAARADEPEIIAKARSYLGPESALDSVKSIHFSGTFTQPDPADSSKVRTAKIDIYFEKPFRELVRVTYPDHGVRTGLDGYDAWQKDSSAPDSLQLFKVAMIADLRADAWENLYFYRDIEAAGGSLDDLGPITVDGIACEKVVFDHGSGIAYTRCIDKATGKVVSEETAAGVTIHEEGEIVADGIRFPQVIETVAHVNGHARPMTYTFDKVTVNEAMPDSLFELPFLDIPAPSPSDGTPAAAPAPAK